MTETTNSQAKKSSDGTSIPSKDLVDLPEDILKAIQYLEYRRLRHKHPQGIADAMAEQWGWVYLLCLLYTSDAADE